jgi:hypothetical protein
MYRFTIVPIFLALLALSRGSAAAQQPESQQRRPTRVPVTLAMADTPSAVPYRIIRRADQAPYDVVLFSASADSAAASDAISDLILMRQVQGDTVPTGDAAGMMRVQGAGGGRVESRPIPWAGRVMRDLTNAARKDVPGVGTLRSVQIWLPPQRRRSPRP